MPIPRITIPTQFDVHRCGEGHDDVYFRDGDCPACKEISKRLTEVNALEVKLALAENKISILEGTIDSLTSRT